jgi:hypothetical protein
MHSFNLIQHWRSDMFDCMASWSGSKAECQLQQMEKKFSAARIQLGLAVVDLDHNKIVSSAYGMLVWLVM